MNDDELIRTNFNSNDQCLCGTKPPNSDIINVLDRYNFLNSTELEKETPIASSIVGNATDQFIDLKPNFKYYDIHEFHKLKQNKISKSTTSIIHTNIGSLQANIDKLEIVLTDLEFIFDVISITETWNPEHKTLSFSPKILDDYKSYLGTTGTTTNDGCGFYINEDLNYIERKDLNFKFKESDEECESIWIELINLKKPNRLIGTIYRHPTKKYTLFINTLRNTYKIKKEKKTVMISGDFNLNLLHYDKKEMVTNFLNVMLTNNLQPCITESTRIINNCIPSLVDNIFINTLDTIHSGNILENISYDHLPNFLILESELLKQTKKTITVRDIKKFYSNEFTRELYHLNLCEHIELAENANTAYNIFHKRFLSLLNKHAPYKSLTKREINISQKPWLTIGILTSINIKRKLFKTFKNSNQNEIYIRYKKYRDLLN